jgi:predicted site-specific integrase-resolvase
MVQDLVSVVTCFGARLYGSHGGRKVKEDIQKSIQELEKGRSKNTENNHESHTD